MRVRSTFGRFQEWAAGAVFRADGAGDFWIYVSIVHDVVILHLPVARKVSCVARTLTPCSDGAHPTSHFCPFQAASSSRSGTSATLALAEGVHDHPQRDAHARATTRELSRAHRRASLRLRLGSSHSVRAVEGGPCVPPLPPQVPRMADIDVSAAIAIFPLFYESLEVCVPPI